MELEKLFKLKHVTLIVTFSMFVLNYVLDFDYKLLPISVLLLKDIGSDDASTNPRIIQHIIFGDEIFLGLHHSAERYSSVRIFKLPGSVEMDEIYQCSSQNEECARSHHMYSEESLRLNKTALLNVIPFPSDEPPFAMNYFSYKIGNKATQSIETIIFGYSTQSHDR
ncbi:hypothetical protein Ciccas_005522 [Cichlidogyrus casuarinus]|uniref:Sema domain-containing protein n=1 Tax=Cichlidogyrus casuarinus TaxID=1844966 RepID=A0ABD2Q9F1_9PLAT